MCGIAGFLNFGEHRAFALAANELQWRRGPDAHGVWSTDELSLSHRRLSIIDLSARANQPFEKDGFVIIFNGEIYNHGELRRALEPKGASFKTESDTEVILEAYRILGPRCLDLLQGMFAFAIWNEVERKLFLARDPLGIKPLYFYHKGRRFAFASELKTLVRILPSERRISAAGLASLLTYLWIPSKFCILEEFVCLQPGYSMTVTSDGGIQLDKYWSVPDGIEKDASEVTWLDRLDKAINESVDRHLVADVEVAAFLSGGLDSSLICALAAKRNPNLQTFTIATDAAAKRIERMSSDEIYARKVAHLLGTKHHEIEIKPDLVNNLPKFMDAVDEPIGDPAAINTRLICAGAREAGVKVLLSGMGADEIFFGYRRQKAWLYARYYRKIPKPLRTFIARGVQALPVRLGQRGFRSVRWAKKFVSFANLDEAASYQSSFSYYSPERLGQFLNEPWRQGVEKVEANFHQIFDQGPADDAVNRLCFTDILMFLPSLNLAYTDRASMAASTEVRVPFVDRRVVELGMRIPGELKFRNGRSKYLLKRVAERYLPREIVDRPKASFGAPLRAWISGDLRTMVDDLLAPTRVKRRGWVDPTHCQRMIETDRSGQFDFSYQIYQLLVLELWAQGTLDRPYETV